MSKCQEFLAQGTTNKAWYRDYVNPINPSGVMKMFFLFRNILQAHVILNHTAPCHICHMYFPVDDVDVETACH